MTSERVLSIFKNITKIPRQSGHEEKIIAYLQDFAAQHSLECHTDKVGNVLIVKEATEGYEDVPTIVLQSHSDMVCEKNKGVEHDFSKDPIKYVIEDGWMIAKETTLGADCGIGIAAQLAILESDLPSGKIECLFTVEEETGLVGAFALEPDFITGKVLINLDSEDEGELFVGCAGGLDTTALFRYEHEDIILGHKALKVRIYNALGGHSGDDIDKGRANAVKLLSRVLFPYIDWLQLCTIDGGNMRNAIAREAEAVITLPEDKAKKFQENFTRLAKDIKSEYATVEPELTFECKEVELPDKAISTTTAKALIHSMFIVPHGVLAMSMDLKGLVETSTNLASVKMLEDQNAIRIGSSQRSSITSARRWAGDKVAATFALVGAEVAHESEYPGWKPNMNSELLKISVASYKKLFGNEPIVRAIHAGLECGLFLDKYPDLDMISFGPTIKGAHAPGERLELASLDKFVELLKYIIVNYKK